MLQLRIYIAPTAAKVGLLAEFTPDDNVHFRKRGASPRVG